MPFCNHICQIIVENVTPDHFENGFGIGSLGFIESPWGSVTVLCNFGVLWDINTSPVSSQQITLHGRWISIWMWMHQAIFNSYRDHYITIILVVVENLKLFRKNCGVAVLGSSPFLDYQMLSNGCLSLKTRAPYLAQIHVVIRVPGGCHRRGQPPRISWYMLLAIRLVLLDYYLLFFVL